MNKQKVVQLAPASTSDYEKLAAIDVSEHAEKKGQFTYLSWAWAHDYCSRLDSGFFFTVHDFPVDSEGVIRFPYLATPAGCFVRVTVTLHDKPWTETLPVLDYKNKTVSFDAVTAMDINTAIKRCFVKAVALHGLGLYIYAGEDLPQEPDISDVPAHEVALTSGKLRGNTLGDLATRMGWEGLGHLRYLSLQSPDPVLKSKAAELWELHGEPMSDDSVLDAIQDADTIEELVGLNHLLTTEQKSVFKPTLTGRRAEIEEGL